MLPFGTPPVPRSCLPMPQLRTFLFPCGSHPASDSEAGSCASVASTRITDTCSPSVRQKSRVDRPRNHPGTTNPTDTCVVHFHSGWWFLCRSSPPGMQIDLQGVFHLHQESLIHHHQNHWSAAKDLRSSSSRCKINCWRESRIGPCVHSTRIPESLTPAWDHQPLTALRGSIPTSFLEPSPRAWSRLFITSGGGIDRIQ